MSLCLHPGHGKKREWWVFLLYRPGKNHLMGPCMGFRVALRDGEEQHHCGPTATRAECKKL